MKNILSVILFMCMLTACSEKKTQIKNDFIVADGQMPNVTIDKHNTIHLVYGSGDSILYCYSADNANSFSKPSLIAVLPHVYTFAMRGPQIAAAGNGIAVTACTSLGDIYSFYKADGDGWIQGKKVNDADTTAKEGLMALSADGENVFAAWLDLRGNERNKIYGAKSGDGGKTWSKNILIYASPDSSVCECCKPSLVIKGNNVYVMFRNWLNGNRDLYLTQSGDEGNTFSPAQKLGNGSWKLNGCPMDGGNLAINNEGNIQTVWRREGKVFTAVPGMPEKEIGEGKGCTVEIVNNKNVYAWAENSDVVILKSNGQKQIIGKGNQPILKVLNSDHVLCVWEDEKEIHASVIAL